MCCTYSCFCFGRTISLPSCAREHLSSDGFQDFVTKATWLVCLPVFSGFCFGRAISLLSRAREHLTSGDFQDFVTKATWLVCVPVFVGLCFGRAISLLFRAREHLTPGDFRKKAVLQLVPLPDVRLRVSDFLNSPTELRRGSRVAVKR